MNTMDVIRARRSVRTFDGKPLTAEDTAQIIEYANKVENPYGLPIEWKLLNVKNDGVSSPVITGTDTFIAGKMKHAEHAEEAFGYAFEKIILYAGSLGIGTTWIAGTMDRNAFERAMNLEKDEVMPCVSPLGYPAAKMSFRETMMRKGVKADSRLPFEKVFYDGSFDVHLTKKKAGKVEPALEAVRLGPSAVNRQPWRILVKDDKVHFYKKSGRGMGGIWDVQKIDIGIALCHFEVIAGECGIPVSFLIEDPGIANEELTYIASYKLKED